VESHSVFDPTYVARHLPVQSLEAFEQQGHEKDIQTRHESQAQTITVDEDRSTGSGKIATEHAEH
jgi:hypothetical protein